MDAPLQRHLARVQIITPLSILLNLASLVVCSILIHPSLKEIHETHITQFTPNPNFILLYWGVLFLLQIGFAVLIVVSQKEFTKKTIVYGVGVRLAISNLLLGAWAITWVVNNHASFLAGLVLLSLIGVLLLLTALILAVKYPPSSSRPLDWLFIHVPIKMFLVITLQVDIPQMLFMALGWYDTPKSTETDIRALWPSFGILAGVGALSAIWIFAATDITWAISGIFLYFALLYSKTPELHDRRPEIVAAIILSMVLQAVALLGSLLYKWLGSYSQAEVDHEQEGRVALGRNPQEEAAALRAEAEAEAAAAAARERSLSEAQHHDQSDAGDTSTAASDHASSLERGENNIKVSRRLG
ncbi:uncharacterized protein FA14DRAFT_120209 [Meira miltonrushii]|uniref:Uncharacterized protein n=1 Tax=Meira miltonrushii TaxID=1280837 RepID=A0A316VIJ3_9BASI|nr:uncharacterized protein FA14DRAFT_120209 [Meira miltonrushii]PWN35325.1 hypothetical protein FA14DRAFT_120209 [Meira miltonrushii]